MDRVLVQVGDDTTEWWEVHKVGRKYFYAGVRHIKFDIKTGCQITDNYPQYTAWKSEKEYCISKERKALITECKRRFDTWSEDRFTVSQLNNIIAAMNRR